MPALPISIVCPSTSSPSDSTRSTPPQHRLSGSSYLPMVPPLKKAMSEPRSAHSFSIPKSGSFSHFTTSYSDKVLAEGPTPPSNTAMSREELIKKFCQEVVHIRPESTPPFLLPEHRDATPPMDAP